MACDRDVHEALKKDRTAYEAATYLIGWQPQTRKRNEMELRNCRACNSTLHDGTTRPLRTEFVLRAVA